MENQKNNLPEELGQTDFTAIIDDMWRGFKRFWFLLILLVAVFTAASVGRCRMSYTPMYQAYTTFVVSSNTPYTTDAAAFDQSTSVSLGKTFTYVLNSGALSEVVARDLGLDVLPVSISASSLEDTNLLTISVAGSDPQMCYDVLNSVVENYPTVAEYIIGDTTLNVMDESGLPTEPTNSANYTGAIKTGFMVGVLAAVVVLLGYALTRHTVRREDDLKRYVSITHLGSVPQIRVKKRSGRARILMDEDTQNSIFTESIRGIRNRILHHAEKDNIKSIVVTSANAGEGKTTMAVNLAIALAKKRKRVILIDGDLRNPSVAPAMGINGGAMNISDLLNGGSLTRANAVIYKKLPLLVVPGAKTDAVRNLKEGQINAMLDVLEKQCDYVIIDTPPCGMMSDAAVFARCADAALFVVRQEYTRIDRILQAIELIAETETPIIGYMINGAHTGITGYGYGGYGYGYGGYGYGSKGKKYGYGYGGGYGYGYGYGEEDEESLFAGTHTGKRAEENKETHDETKKSESSEN